ncbi:hypothetical protein Mp_3g12420 [Marchantia polymorpha subsp. ruderalis]|uniref:Uncharacterized protein n=2 Tax=Marchantia polymorpha TaxID=3197 RepID=A0AAF6B029_MARPO|nr:hypothetical protein MARPO_0278s0010 [Marchantia polymorpha]PTQ38584.1 hypothetical protein MARPO_0050s0046 [Marchantia polymorpha]BBN05363.1 hypothetical protein Mp_3g12420 [Marchantia polymorpha subsp. ruderalis]|eukprot:PTQ26896.1 hypothetical protein MARPO_0278s0010 [Marchantia polymorpha]
MTRQGNNRLGGEWCGGIPKPDFESKTWFVMGACFVEKTPKSDEPDDEPEPEQEPEPESGPAPVFSQDSDLAEATIEVQDTCG